MKRPTWATVVSILGIIISLFGMLGAGQDILMPKMMELQKQIFTQMEEMQKRQARREGADKAPDEAFSRMVQSMQKMWEAPEHFGTWSVVTGILKLLVSGFGLFAYICLLQKKPYSVKLVYWALGLGIAVAALKGTVMLSSMSLMAVAMMFGSVFGLVINIVLLIVVIMGDKSAYYQTQSAAVPNQDVAGGL
ncbi:MAG: hypothetical protein P8X96_13825 [Desulfobacteraceae bacterium]|jgi:hypothetical protein